MKLEVSNGKGRKPIVSDGVFIRPWIDGEMYEKLKEESGERGCTMNMIVREMLRERYQG